MNPLPPEPIRPYPRRSLPAENGWPLLGRDRQDSPPLITSPRTGFSVTLFEALSEAGGMLRWGIPAYRLPRQILDREIREILAAGIELKCNTCIGREVLLEELERKFDAIFLAVGAQRSVPLGISG